MSILTFKLTDKSGGACDFADLSNFSTRLTDVLRRVHRAEFAAGQLPRYRVARMEIGSALLGVTSEGLSIANFLETVVSIRKMERPRLPYTGDDIRAFRGLTDPLESHTKTIELNDEIPLDEAFRVACDYLLEHVPKSFGQAIGRNDGLNIHNKKYFRLYPEGVDRGAECYFADDYLDKVKASIGKRIRVEGLIHRNPDGTGLDRITSIRSLEIIPESHELPPLSSLFGMFSGNPVDLCRGWEN